MMDRINASVVSLSMPKLGRDGPIAPYIGSFAQALSEQGYKRGSLQAHVRLAESFSRWLKDRRVRLSDTCLAHVSRYLQHRHHSRRAIPGEGAALGHLLMFLREKGVLQENKPSKLPPTGALRCAQAYEQYLRTDRGLAESTIICYVPFVLSFLKYKFGTGPVNLSSLRAKHVVKFVETQSRQLHSKRAKLMTTALRSFLQYAVLRENLTLNLAASVPIVASWSMAEIPRAIPPEQTKRLLASIDRTTPTGKRDYAMLLLLARIGLRANEVASLELEDIDWSAGQLNVRGKGGHRAEMPLTADVGKAIATYLQHGRPQCSCRRVFLRSKAPLGGLRRTSIGTVVRDRLMRAAIPAPTYGAHQFRHGLASDMLRHGASLAEIGTVLRHANPDTTRIYTKIDLDALRTLSQPWPGRIR